MGQKANLNSLKIFKNNISLNTFNTKNLGHLFFFIEKFERLLNIKGLIVISKTLNNNGSICLFNLVLFYKSHKISFYKRKKLKVKSLVCVFSKKLKKFSALLSNYFSFFKNTLFNFSIKNINKQINKKLLVYVYIKLNKYLKVFFSRRFNLFVDFLKLTTLLIQNLIDSKTFLLLLSSIFKNISKRSHKKFLSFLKDYFKLIIQVNIKKFKLKSKVEGIKFTVGGRLVGKTRSSYVYIQEGNVPNQTFSKNIEFSKVHVYTLLGAFGLRIWLYKV
jgi:hypothetical protein